MYASSASLSCGIGNPVSCVLFSSFFVVTRLEEGFHILRDHYGVLPRLHGCFSPHGCSPHRIWCCSLGRRCKERFIVLCFSLSAVSWVHVTASTLRNCLNPISKSAARQILRPQACLHTSTTLSIDVTRQNLWIKSAQQRKSLWSW